MVKKRTRRRLPRIGWREWAGLPELGIPWIKVKVDTGAATSAIHADDIEPFRWRTQDWVRFTVHPKQKSTKRAVRVEARLIEWRGVRSSNGQLEHRPVIETTIRIGEVEWTAELTLANRDQMGFRMLLGRSSLQSRFLVDCGASFLGPEPKRRSKSLVVENGNGAEAKAKPASSPKAAGTAKAVARKTPKTASAKSGRRATVSKHPSLFEPPAEPRGRVKVAKVSKKKRAKAGRTKPRGAAVFE